MTDPGRAASPASIGRRRTAPPQPKPEPEPPARPARVVLTEQEQARVEELVEMALHRPQAFERLVYRHVRNPTTASMRIMRAPALIGHTWDTLRVLARNAEARRAQAMRHSERRRQSLILEQIRAERAELRARHMTALSREARKTPRHRAEAVIGEVLYEDLSPVVKDLKRGMSAEEAAAKLRTRLAQEGLRTQL